MAQLSVIEGIWIVYTEIACEAIGVVHAHENNQKEHTQIIGNRAEQAFGLVDNRYRILIRRLRRSSSVPIRGRNSISQTREVQSQMTFQLCSSGMRR